MVADGKQVIVTRKNGGFPVDARDLPWLLAKPTAVLSFPGGKVDPYYLKVMRDDVLIIIQAPNSPEMRPQVPGKKMPGGPQPPAVPMPKLE